MLYTVHLYDKTEDVKKGYGDIVSFTNLTTNGAFDIVKLAMDFGKAVSVIPASEAEDASEDTAPVADGAPGTCNGDYCNI